MTSKISIRYCGNVIKEFFKMGAAESHGKQDYWQHETKRRANFSYKNSSRKKDQLKKGKLLPPPDKPSASDITHNSLILSWNPPIHNGTIVAYTVEMCHVSDNHWLVLTYSCQGCQYKVRNLQPDQMYIFRVRAENVHGTSKPSVPSDPVQTDACRVEITYHDADKPTKPVRRRHSFNVPLEGAVVSILNHTDTIVESTGPARNPTSGTHSAESTFQRGCFRTSLDPCRKRSLASLLPGTRTDSIARMRDSYRRSTASRSSLFAMQGINRSANTSRSDISCSAYTSKSDISETPANSRSDVSNMDTTMEKRFSNTSDSQTSQTSSSEGDEMDRGSVGESGDIWEKQDNDILKASLSDEIKLALCSTGKCSVNYNDKFSFDKLANVEKDHIMSPLNDFRTLRHMLHSTDIIFKPAQSDYIDYNSNGTHFNKLSTINDDEEEEFVRVTTI